MVFGFFSVILSRQDCLMEYSSIVLKIFEYFYQIFLKPSDYKSYRDDKSS